MISGYLLNLQTRRRKDLQLEKLAEGEDADAMDVDEEPEEDTEDEAEELPSHKRSSVKRPRSSRVVQSDDESSTDDPGSPLLRAGRFPPGKISKAKVTEYMRPKFSP